MEKHLNRCRLIVAAGPQVCSPEQLEEALAKDDVACVILRDHDSKPGEFEAYCRKAVQIAQAAGSAALISADTQTMGRVDADGLYVETSHSEVRDYVARFSPHKLVGCGGMMDRHNALIYGEANPDFVMFGKLGRDIRPEPHPKNLALAEWWAEFVEVPGVVLGGNIVESVVAAAQTGSDFVLLEQAIFAGPTSCVDAVSQANRLLDEHAPMLDLES